MTRRKNIQSISSIVTTCMLLLFCMQLVNYPLYGQRVIPATDSLIFTGQVLHPVAFRLTDLDTSPTNHISDLIIYNYKGEIKDTLKGMKGIPLPALLAAAKYMYDKPKSLN